MQERADRELTRRSRVVQVLPGRRSPIGTTGTVFSEMAGDGAGRRRFGDDSIGRAVEGTAAEYAARIIAPMVADDPIPGRKAAQHAPE